MPEGLPRLCIFGDSHYACLKQAEMQGLVDVSGVELEYWGHVGGRFRYLAFRDGAIHPIDDFTAMRFAKFNVKGRTFLAAADFDVILVMGARIYLWRLFQGLLQALSSGPLVSSGLVRRILTDGLRGQAGYRLASGLARTGTARVLLAPIAFHTANEARFAGMITPEMAAILPERLPVFWRILHEVTAEDGITIIQQPAETMVDGLFTDPAFAVEGYLEKQDFEHHNLAYGAVILREAMPLVRQVARRA
jgi:hypothetical protein